MPLGILWACARFRAYPLRPICLFSASATRRGAVRFAAMNLPANATRIEPQTFARCVRSAIRRRIIDGWEGLAMVVEHRLAIDAKQRQERRAA